LFINSGYGGGAHENYVQQMAYDGNMNGF